MDLQTIFGYTIKNECAIQPKILVTAAFRSTAAEPTKAISAANLEMGLRDDRLVWLAAGCQRRMKTRSEPGSPGVTAQEVILFVPAPGPCQLLGSQTLRGAMCYLNYINENGGIHGRGIKVIAYDDSYDPPGIANTRSSSSTIRCLPCSVTVNAHDGQSSVAHRGGPIPLLGMFTGANACASLSAAT
jgi:hypothetical protein